MKFKTEASIDKLIQKLTHGCKKLSHVKGLSPSQVHILVAGLLGAGMGMAGLFMALRDGKMDIFPIPWISEQGDSSKDLCVVAGLQNLGNNCFLNVILQALSSCSCFLSFLQNVLVADDSIIEEKAEEMPLSVALVSLLKDLHLIRGARTVLSPRRVMLAMGLYVTSFSLTRQQDAAEALLHLLSSLGEEFSQCFVPQICSLADIYASPCRISCPKSEGQSESVRWQQHFVGPLDGTVGSILTCRSCSSQISMDFEVLHCLPLSPMLDRNNAIMDGCTVADCLKQFTATEHLENYRCSRCWHITALKYLSLKAEENEENIKILGYCLKPDSCDCKSLLLHEGVSWPDGFSNTFKQLTIARCPKILCIHLQRASMSEHGELIKLQGHISFPLVLDLFPFTAAAMKMGLKTLEGDMQRQVEQKQPSSTSFNMQWKMHMVSHMHGFMGEHPSFEALSGNKLVQPIYKSLDEPVIQTLSGGDDGDTTVLESKMVSSNCPHSQDCSTPVCRSSDCDKKVSISWGSSKSYMYRLASVVEHYGRAGSGHYVVYRSLVESDAKCHLGRFNKLDHRWVYVSDHEVSSVSEETVLAAEASLLFYEIIEECT